jgi:DNA-directed RNA polymerase specialized sigma24 family protein
VSDSALQEELGPRAFGIAYRMLGSVADEQDIAQEALLREHHALERGEADFVSRRAQSRKRRGTQRQQHRRPHQSPAPP